VFLVTIVSLRETGVSDNKNNNFIKISFFLLTLPFLFVLGFFVFVSGKNSSAEWLAFFTLAYTVAWEASTLTGNSLWW